ncbi:MAG TPA: DUF389 domain-containing protein [Kofleriaceae bacterium]|nr:DUF389 domain-containing protein [Kofleriaceae bacterium]
MVHLRIPCTPEKASDLLAYLARIDLAAHVAHLAGVSPGPDSDLVMCDLPREAGSAVIRSLRGLGHEEIFVHAVDAAVSRRGERAALAAPGTAADAVLWEEVTAKTSESSELTVTYLLFMIVATAFGAIGVLTDSVILIVGAMVVGPEFGPLAGLCVASAERRWRLAASSGFALVFGFVVAILMTYVLVLLLVAAGAAPEVPAHHPATLFISRPDAYSAVVATLAGIVGMLSLTTAKSGALIGVLISVTTIPAAGNIAVAAVYRNGDELSGAITQLGLNLSLLVAAGLATLAVQRLAFTRRLRQLFARSVARRLKARTFDRDPPPRRG